MTVNGKPLTEDYLPAGAAPSTYKFSVTLRSGQIWVMGDNRAISYDSRGWGPVPKSAIVARVFALLHNTSLVGIRTPGTFVADGLAPPDTRSYPPTVVICFAVILISVPLLPVMLLGIAIWQVRQSRRRRALAAQAFAAGSGVSAG